MFLTISLSVVCVILASVNMAVAEKPFKNKTARAAHKVYEAAIAKAKVEYVAKLEIAIKEAGGAGDLEEANRIAVEKKSIESGQSGKSNADPVEALRRRMIGTRWNTSATNSKNWIRFLKKGAGADYRGKHFSWFVAGKNTVVYQYKRKKDFNFAIYMFHFDANLKSATGHVFNKHSKTFPVKRLR
ncbi:MAG: hypothetical protein IID45_08495 [Planctomycetes bacterium]|nr:hypothetical protein [Planctomycetota bacterium]